MAVEKFQDLQSHEGDLHLIYRKHGLDPYYAMDSIRKEYSGWKSDGKPTANVAWEGEQWALCYDYDTDNPLDPWEHESYQLHTVPEFRFYFVCQDGLYEGERADQSKRVRGGTITVRPRWPNLTANGGEPVQGVPNLGAPYIDVQVQASNIDHAKYEELAQTIFGAFGVSTYYFQGDDQPHEMSNWNDLAIYTRIDRDASGPIYAADGPLSRVHNPLQGDREGYRKHVEDHRELPGYYVTSSVTDDRARDLVQGHQLGKEIKHYYPNNPEMFEPDHPLYHPKLEASYQTSLTEQTVYWSDTEDAVRELEETILNVLDWSGLPTSGGDPFVQDEYFSAADGPRRTRKIVDCPLPEIEDGQEAAVMNLWQSSRESDQAVIDQLLTDGGKQSPKRLSEETGYSYRTIREVVSRCSDVIDHAYSEVQIRSKHQQELLKDRLHAAESNFKNAVEDAAMTAAEVAGMSNERTKWSRVRQRYNVTVDGTSPDARKKIKIGYNPKGRTEARQMLQELRNAYRQTHADRQGVNGIVAVVTLEDGTRKRYRSMGDDLATVGFCPGEEEASNNYGWERDSYLSPTG